MTWHVCETLFAVTASRSAALPWKLALSSKEASGVRRRVSVKAGVRRGHAGPGLVLQHPMTSSVRYGEALELNLLLRSINGPDMSFAHRPDYGFLLGRVL
jgi:hypothetical protein